MIAKIINWILELFGFTQKKEQENTKQKINNTYTKKRFMTEYETAFFNKIKELENDYRIIPQVNLATIIDKQARGYRSELFRNIDFAIFDKEYNELLLLIELNDSTHYQTNRRQRDKNVQEICKSVGIKLITFYTKYPNEKQWVLNRINNELTSVKNNTNANTEFLEAIEKYYK